MRAFVLLAALLAPAAVTAAPEQPNILLIIVDDMGWQDLGCYGQRGYETPNIDRLAHEGVRFTDAYSGCTVCAPARCTLLTGRHMGNAAVRGNSGGIPLPDAEVTIAEVLRPAGYRCGGFGKWGLGDIGTEGVPELQGFDVFYGYYHQIHAHDYYPEFLVRNGRKEPLAGGDYTHYRIFEETKEFIRENRDRPFFCYAPWTPPHARYQIPDDDPAWLAVADKPWGAHAKGHAAFNLMLDRHVGELMALLDELHIAERTVVFFCSDNGASGRFEGELDSSGPLTGFKRSMHEGGLRVPLIARWQGKTPPGVVSELPTYFPDLLPTVAEIAGVSAPEGLDGLSIVPTLVGDDARQRKHEGLYWEWPLYDWEKSKYVDLMQAARRGAWKILRHSRNSDWRLYNLTEDISEQHDLAEEHPEIVESLVAWIDANRTEMPAQVEPPHPPGRKFN